MCPTCLCACLYIYQTVRRSVHVGVGLMYLRHMSGEVYTTCTRCGHIVKICVHIASATPCDVCVSIVSLCKVLVCIQRFDIIAQALLSNLHINRCHVLHLSVPVCVCGRGGQGCVVVFRTETSHQHLRLALSVVAVLLCSI